MNNSHFSGNREATSVDDAGEQEIQEFMKRDRKGKEFGRGEQILKLRERTCNECSHRPSLIPCDVCRNGVVTVSQLSYQHSCEHGELDPLTGQRCTSCKGSGWGWKILCKSCAGTGYELRQCPGGNSVEYLFYCPKCKGTRKICSDCNGEGREPKDKEAYRQALAEIEEKYY